MNGVSLCRPERGRMDIAALTTPAAGRLPLWLRRLERCATCLLEGYTVIETDLLVLGADPLISAIVARLGIIAGHRVLLVVAADTSEYREVAAAELARCALLPETAHLELLRAFPFLVGTPREPLKLVRNLSNWLALRRVRGNRVEALLKSGLIPDAVSSPNLGRQILWRSSPSEVPASAPRALPILTGALLHGLPKKAFPAREQFKNELVLAQRVVLVSPYPSFRNTQWQVPMRAIAGAARPIVAGKPFDGADRLRDIMDALSLEDWLLDDWLEE